MARVFRLTTLLLPSAVCFLMVNGEVFLKHEPRGSRGLSDAASFQAAMSTVMGCGPTAGNHVDTGKRLAVVEQELTPMWRVVPKNGYGNVEWRLVRYIAHRYFLQRSSLLIKGLEPLRHANDSHIHSVDILSKRVPALVDMLLQGKHASDGFSLKDVSVLVATMEQLIYESEGELLETTYRYQGKFVSDQINYKEFSALLESYFIHWMLHGDPDVLAILLENRTLLAEEVPHWDSIVAYLNGLIRRHVYSRQHAAGLGHGPLIMQQLYSFSDVHEVVATLTKTFADYWESECQGIKESLVGHDKSGSGRVTLSDFYGANTDGEWRFGESESYLRDLGILDETSSWRGNQVIIPNYIQGASNCIIASSHYFICCKNECEDILLDIENAIGEPVALPEQVLDAVGSLTNFEDEPPKMSNRLKEQLLRIAATHGGKVPLHGRLFAQWLHYVFPRECPFPHKSGTSSFTAPTEYAGEFVAAESDIQDHAAQRNSTAEKADSLERERAMSQWSEDEELIADYALELRAPWGTGCSFAGCFGIAACAAFYVWRAMAKIDQGGALGGEWCSDFKCHFV